MLNFALTISHFLQLKNTHFQCIKGHLVEMSFLFWIHFEVFSRFDYFVNDSFDVKYCHEKPKYVIAPTGKTFDFKMVQLRLQTLLKSLKRRLMDHPVFYSSVMALCIQRQYENEK